MDNEMLNELMMELKGEFQISPFFDDETIINLIKDAESNILSNISSKANFENDREVRALLKNYVKYAINNLKDEFEIRYATDYLNLQIKYNS